MKNKLYGAHLKLAHALELVNELELKVQTYFDPDKIKLEIVTYNDEGARIARIKHSDPFPELLPLRVGDIITNIKSSLDYLAVELSKLKTGKKKNRAHFPIAGSYEEYQNLEVKLKKQFSDEVIELFKEFKPYKGGNEVLYALSSFRNDNIHNFILPMGTLANASLSRIRVFHSNSGLIPPGPFKLDEGVVISDLGLHGNIIYDDNAITVNASLIFWDVDEYLNGYDVLYVLKVMHDLAFNMVGMFEMDFFQEDN